VGDVEHELRLLWAIVLNGLLLIAAFQTARAFGGGELIQTWLDALLLWWSGQYLVVGSLGLIGWLSPATATAGGVVLSVIAFLVTRASSRSNDLPVVAGSGASGRFAIQLGLAIVSCEVAAVVWQYRVLPPMSDDALTYHLPAAATWLREGRIGIYETWFFNPANTFSPLGGSLFAAWFMIPFQSDVAARFMQTPAVIAIFLAGVQLVLRLGGSTRVAVLLATAGALSAPVVRQMVLAKDDLFLTAFVLIFINGLLRVDRLGAIRLGLALGLAAATKVTCVYALAPAMLLLLPLPLQKSTRPRLKRVLAIAGITMLVAGPWYLRNLLHFANPIFPTEVRAFGMTILPGLFVTTHSPRLREWAGLNETFITGYFSFGWVMGVLAVSACAGAILFGRRAVWHDPIARICVMGPLIGTVAFVFTSPYAEVRFLYPWFLTAIFAIALWPACVRLAMAAVAVSASLATSFASDLLFDLLPKALAGVIVWQILRFVMGLSRRVRAGVIGTLICTAAGAVWVNWRSYVLGLPALADYAWEEKYQDLGRAWVFLRNETPADAPVAYTGTYLTHPLLGAQLTRCVAHVPVSATVTSLAKLPGFTMPMSARNMLREAIPAAATDADESLWKSRLSGFGAEYFLIKLHPPGNATVPIEWHWVRRDPRFTEVFRSGDVFVFAIAPASPG